MKKPYIHLPPGNQNKLCIIDIRNKEKISGKFSTSFALKYTEINILLGEAVSFSSLIKEYNSS